MADIRGKTFDHIADKVAPGETFTVGSFDVEELRDKLPPGDVVIHEPRRGPNANPSAPCPPVGN